MKSAPHERHPGHVPSGPRYRPPLARQRITSKGPSSARVLCSGIINDILDFSKIEAGKMGLEEHRFPARRVIANAMTLVRQRGEKSSNPLPAGQARFSPTGEPGRRPLPRADSGPTCCPTPSGSRDAAAVKLAVDCPHAGEAPDPGVRRQRQRHRAWTPNNRPACSAEFTRPMAPSPPLRRDRPRPGHQTALR